MNAWMRILKGLALFAALAVFALLVLLGSLRLEHTFSTSTPAPTGSFGVGRAIYDWVDATADDSLAPVPGRKRELLVWIWYPSRKRQLAAVPDSLPAPMRAGIERARAPGNPLASLMTNFLTRDPMKLRVHSTPNAELSPEQRKYPVAIMRGGASSGVTNYSTLAEDLASHGYVVVGFDAPYRTSVVVFPDGRTIRRTPENNPELIFGRPDSTRLINRLLAAWIADIGFTLDRLQQLDASDSSGRFTGRLDLSRVGVFGHSLGGATVAQFCHDDSRCKAGIDIDGAPLGTVVREGVPHPFMFLLADYGHASDPASRTIMANIQSIYDRVPANERLRISIRGANHFLFSDDGALLKSHILLSALRRIGVVHIDGPRQLAVTAFAVRSFFDGFLKSGGMPSLRDSLPAYPEIRILQ